MRNMDRKPQRHPVLDGRKPTAGLTMLVIYDHPLDYPNHFVVRRWLNDVPDRECTLFGNLRDARLSLPRGMTRLPRWEGDDPNIVEVWL